jgi:hypothetical protein
MFMYLSYRCNYVNIVYAQVNNYEYHLNKVTGHYVSFFLWVCVFSNVATHSAVLTSALLSEKFLTSGTN